MCVGKDLLITAPIARDNDGPAFRDLRRQQVKFSEESQQEHEEGDASKSICEKTKSIIQSQLGHSDLMQRIQAVDNAVNEIYHTIENYWPVDNKTTDVFYQNMLDAVAEDDSTAFDEAKSGFINSLNIQMSPQRLNQWRPSDQFDIVLSGVLSDSTEDIHDRISKLGYGSVQERENMSRYFTDLGEHIKSSHPELYCERSSAKLCVGIMTKVLSTRWVKWLEEV